MTRPVACTVPLKGSQLIEAAAGTGKTWTIASLVVRLVVTGDGPGGQAMDIQDILVLTFTRAATRELVDRIRNRLVQCRRAFTAAAGAEGVEGAAPAAEGADQPDPVIAELLQRLAHPIQRREAIWRLDRAVAAMDTAAVTTIDAWVQRVLREQVRGVGDEPLGPIVEHDEGWVRRAVLDYWRQEIYPLDDAAMDFVAEAYLHPQPLIAALLPHLRSRQSPLAKRPSHPAPTPQPDSPAQTVTAPPQPGATSQPTWPSRAAAESTLAEALGPMPLARAARLQQLKQACASLLPAIHAWLHEAFSKGAVPPAAVPLGADGSGPGPGTAGASRQSSKAEKPRPLLNGNRLRAAWVQRPLEQLREWSAGRAAGIDGWTQGKRVKTTEHLMPQGLLDSFNEMHRPATAPAWSRELQEIVEEVASMPRADVMVIEHALPWVSNRLHTLKSEACTWGFDDLLRQLDDALESDPNLAERLRRTYPVALIDEFQDTSAQQFQVFDRIYRIGLNDETTGLLLIGDPKQSIYRFRGADIHSYLRARRLTAGRIHELAVNFRSTPHLVDAVNHLFSRAEQRAGEAAEISGAFLHGPDVPFHPAAAAPSAVGPLKGPQPQTQPLPVLCVWTESTVRSSAAAREWDAAVAAERIVALLHNPHAGRLDPTSRTWCRLRPRDCCVLVRTGTEASAMRRALSNRGLASAYLSERDYVFHSSEARDVLDLLRALDQPADIAAARRVWASRMVGLDWSTQLRQASDPILWDRRLDQLATWREVWATQGVLSALRRFVLEEDVARRALADETVGERRLTNVLHLAEWLQEVSERVRGPKALIDALSQAIDSEEAAWRVPAGSQAHLLRLESEADVVQIVTIHKSKGLQYPVVFLPFISLPRDHRRKPSDGWAVEASVDEDEESGPDGSDQAAAGHVHDEREERREDIRLLYVAMTRAIHQLWIGASPRVARAASRPASTPLTSSDTKCKWDTTAVGHLVSGGARTAGQVTADLQALVDEWSTSLGASVQFERLDGASPAVTRYVPDSPTTQHAHSARPALEMRAAVDTRWQITSYSALVRGAGEGAEASGRLPDWSTIRWDEAPSAGGLEEEGEAAAEGFLPLVSSATPGLHGGPWHGLRSSAELGQFMHELLEHCAESGFRAAPGSVLRAELESMILSSAWAQDHSVLLAWLDALMDRPIHPWGVPLAGLTEPRAELEFWLPLQPIHTDGLDHWCRRHIWPELARPRLRPHQIEGLLMGFADLVFRAGPRHGVLDYKSNRLGPGPDAYGAEALKSAVMAHRYDVQAALYLLALHRLLKRRLGSVYCASHHLGPAQFLFLRGIDHPNAGLLSVELDGQALQSLDELIGYPVVPLDGSAA